ncbi:hypothetical protein quinque_014260 [Culex quinquefasciatus]
MNFSTGSGAFNPRSARGTNGEHKSEGVLPVMLRHIQESPEEGIELFGYQYATVTFVAIVRQIVQTPTKVTYRMEDHTAQLDAHRWIDEEHPDQNDIPVVRINSYARVIGSVRNEGKGSDRVKAVMIFKISQVDSPNEITTHLLEVLNARYKGEEYAKKAGISGIGGSREEIAEANSMGLSRAQMVVYKAIKHHISDIGISREELQAKFPHISPTEMTRIIDEMIQEGLVYTSADVDHFLCVT